MVGFTDGNLEGASITGLYDSFLTRFLLSGNKHETTLLGAANAWTWSYGVATDFDGNVFTAGITYGALPNNVLNGARDGILAKNQ